TLESLGTRRKVNRGEIIYKTGQRDVPFHLVLSGELEVFESRDGDEQILATPGPRDFVGDIAMLTGTAVVATVRGKAGESEILQIPAARLRRALAEIPSVSETIVSALIMRRKRLQRDREFTGLRILADRDSREGLNTVVLESYATGGQAGASSLIENFFGFPTGISGGDLTYRAQLQAFRFGAKFTTPSQALSLGYTPDAEHPHFLHIEGCNAVL